MPSRIETQFDLETIAELEQRPSRSSAPEAENQVLLSLMQQLTGDSKDLLREIACAVLHLCRAHSAVISIAEQKDGRDLCHWRAVAGRWQDLPEPGLPRDVCPSGLAMDRGEPLLLSYPEQNFLPPGIRPAAHEILIVPFHAAKGWVGAIWAISHEEGLRFDLEDLRLLSSLARFAGAAYQVWSSQNRLRESEQRFRQMIDALPAAVYATDANGVVTYANPAAVQIAGRVPLLGQDRWCVSWKMFRPDGSPVPHEECPLALALRGDRIIPSTGIIAEQPGGKRVHITPHPALLFDDKGRVTGGVNLLLNNTQRNHNADTPSMRGGAPVDVMETASVSLHWLGADGTILWANQIELDLLGYAPDQYIGHHFSEFYMDPAPMAAVLERVKHGETAAELDAQLRHRDGSIRHVIINTGGVFEDNQFVHARCLTTDITQRRIAEEAQARLAAIVESSDDAIVGKTLDGIITSWNAGAERIFGYTPQEAVGQHISLIIPSDRLEEEQGVLACIRRGERLDHFETVRRAKDGRRLNISLTVSPIKDSSGRIIGASKVARDITERKLAEEEYRQTQKLESIGVLAGGIAHDFNNLLTGILGNASLAMEMLPWASSARDLLNEVVRASERAAGLTRQMLAYAGKGHFVLEPVDISAMAREISTLIRASIPKSVHLHLDLADCLPTVQADASQLQQLIMNLVINGAEAIGEGNTGTVHVTTTARNLSGLQLRQMFRQAEINPGYYVILQVWDTGCGMDEATRARIFDPFFTTKFTGRGLGLAAVLGIVRSHKGAIRVSSVPGEGSTFEVVLPAGAAIAAIPATGTTTANGLTRPAPILVVDDEDIVRRTAKATLQKYGCTVLLAQNGREAVEILQSHPDPISLVLLDLTMPVMSGEEALERLHAIRPDLPVILTSGYSQEEAVAKIDPAALADFLQKPYTAAELVEKVRKVLAQQESK